MSGTRWLARPRRGRHRNTDERATTSTALAQASLLMVDVARTFTFAEVAQAHELLARGGAGGRIVLTPAESGR
ncbi:zinc-binding dehydrogenase [Mycobacterium sp.]|uniref:zinc-binding dehydrogenase n=1 Tax=Mycobacterium sp. TaxID=1785 RepID=UPI003D0D0294